MRRKFQVKVTKRFERKLGRLALNVQTVVLERASELGISPYLGKRLKGSLQGLYSLRVGEYRVIYWIDEEKMVIWLLEVEHRRRVYRG